MASRYWVGGTATWDGTAGTKWATTSGGAGGSAIPTAADDVFFDSASGAVTVTLSSSSVARSIDCNTFTGTISHPAALTISIGDGTAGAGNRALRLVSGMTYTKGDAATSAFTFVSTSVTQQTVDAGGKTMGNITFNGVGGSWTLSGATFNFANTATLTWTAGTFTTSNINMTGGTFVVSGSTTRSISLGSSVIIPNGTSGTTWNAATTTNLTFNAGTSTIRYNAGNIGSSFSGGGLTYYNLDYTNTSGNLTIAGSNTWNNFSAVTGTGIRQLTPSAGTTQTINGLLTLTGLNANLNRLAVQSGTQNSPATFAMGASSTFALTNVDFRDIAFTGTGTPVTGASLADCYGNSGITFTTPLTLYWIPGGTNGTGSWSDVTHWSTTSGGSAGTVSPLAHDTVIFDNNSLIAASQTVTMDCYRIGKDVDFSGLNATFASTFTLANGNQSSSGSAVFGNLVLKSGMSTSVTGASPSLNLVGRGTHTLTTNGVVIASNSVTSGINFACVIGTYTLQDSLTTTGRLLISTGSFVSNNKDINAQLFDSSNSSTRSITLGTSTITLSGTGTIFNIGTTTGLTYSGASATIIFTDASASSKTFSTGAAAAIHGNFIALPGGAGAIVFNSNNKTFNSINIIGAKTVTFAASTVYTVASPNFSGSAGNIVTLQSSSAGTPFTLSTPSGYVRATYASIKDSTATGGAYFEAVNSVDVSGNTGWNFVTASAGGGFQPGKKFAAFGGARPINKVLDSKLHGYRKLGG